MTTLRCDHWAELPFDTRVSFCMMAAKNLNVGEIHPRAGYLSRTPRPPYLDFIVLLQLPNEMRKSEYEGPVSLNTFSECSAEMRICLFQFVCASLTELRKLKHSTRRGLGVSLEIIGWIHDCIERYESFLDALELHIDVDVPIHPGEIEG